MKKFFSLFVVVALCLAGLLTGCGPEKTTLYLYSWSDYFDPALLAEFEKQNNCRIVYDTFDSNEALLAKLEAGATGYDLIVPSHYMIDILAKCNLIEKLDHSKLNFLANLDPDYLEKMPDAKCEYSIPYMMTYTGIGYNNQVLKDFKPTWNMLDRTDLQKRTTILDDKREVIGAALLNMGYDPNTTDPALLARAKERIRGWLKNISKFENEQYKNGIASREFFLVMGYSGDMMQVVRENPHVSFALPEEGVCMSCDSLAIMKTAPHKELAYKLLNFLFEAEKTKQNIEYTCFLCPNKAAYPLLSEEVRKDPAIFMRPDILKRSYYLKDQGEKEALYNQLWSELKAGK